MINRLDIRTFGGLSIRLGGEPVSGLASRKAEALLVYLACNPRAHPREVLAELLWDDRSQRQAMANLRVVLSSLRKEVGSHVTITRTIAAIDPGAELWLDAAELEAAVDALQADASHLDPASVPALQEALALYKGDFLAGHFLP
jgi:DNA-binding SARP family transcriptional activator